MLGFESSSYPQFLTSSNSVRFPEMDLHQIKQILDLVREHELSEFEIEHDGLRLKIRKEANGAHVVTSPIVGTFYRSSEPGSPAFTEIGASVKKGDVLCIIEAMKLMNEIDSEYDGEVVNIYVENGQPVQYGERLFAIRTR